MPFDEKENVQWRVENVFTGAALDQVSTWTATVNTLFISESKL